MRAIRIFARGVGGGQIVDRANVPATDHHDAVVVEQFVEREHQPSRVNQRRMEQFWQLPEVTGDRLLTVKNYEPCTATADVVRTLCFVGQQLGDGADRNLAPASCSALTRSRRPSSGTANWATNTFPTYELRRAWRSLDRCWSTTTCKKTKRISLCRLSRRSAPSARFEERATSRGRGFDVVK